jgi:choline dehydrogenase
MYIRGHRLDYDEWGLDGWHYDELLPYFRRAERNVRGADAFHGAHGPWHVSDLRDPNPLARAFVDAAAETGIPRNRDFNGPELDGVGLVQVMQRNGRRWSAADAYLRPVRRRANLTVLTDAHVTRVLVRDGRAEGIAYRHRGSGQVARARREVILSAGAIGSPQLLMLSGIGPAEHLRAHGIDIAVDLPGVGQNLQDHVMAPAMWEATKPVTLYSAQSPRELARYLLQRRGMLSSNAVEAAAFLRSDPTLPAPDLEFAICLAEWRDQGLAPPTRHAFGIAPIVLRPRSRGSVTLTAADPTTAPAIRPNYLSDPHDLALLAHGVAEARRIASAAAFDDLRGEELEPGRGASRPDHVEAWIRSRAQGMYHPVGTCRMGTDELAVVDPQLRVRGVARLRIADAAVAPTLVRGHTAALATAIGERAADLVGNPQAAARSARAMQPNLTVAS